MRARDASPCRTIHSSPESDGSDSLSISKTSLAVAAQLRSLAALPPHVLSDGDGLPACWSAELLRCPRPECVVKEDARCPGHDSVVKDEARSPRPESVVKDDARVVKDNARLRAPRDP